MSEEKRLEVGGSEASPLSSKRKPAAGGRRRRSPVKAATRAGESASGTKRTSTRKKPAPSASPKPRTSRSRRTPPAVRLARPNAVPAPLDYEEVARLAYFYWESRGCQGGSPEADWYRAEEELRKRSAQ